MSTESASGYSRKNPFPATLTVNKSLTEEGSSKDTRHLEISLAGSGLSCEVGDSLGVFPSNCPELVELVIQQQGYSGDEPVLTPDGATVPIRQALTYNYILTEPSKQLLEALPAKDPSAGYLVDLLDPGQKGQLDTYKW